ncbi:response regulator [Amycolatopsis acidiphila]|uniref:Transcriptional regulatory protein n=1 Tax=Amycolatopsis acidiphila TaxID=715473 RepID=A0A558AIX7_9PSEU|nr:response regulator [Amycolatopsis acidiphila]TVT24222.1 response regulator [Amycolatopsis acidiphila]UIJ62650.1 response regulator [Amycolatopsis acidiphila]GHG85955.1 transcriptional regulatory protein [Amycolatopsis acidiphila]
MIRTLIVDDDYRVAAIHAASIDRIPGFSCIGQAHTAAEARQAVADLGPDLLLLDVYLPDDDGLSILRGLNSHDAAPPDCIVITAARDLSTVRSAMHLGAVYYLVKPFGLAQLRSQLEAYRQWRQHASGAGEADQATVDTLYNMLRGPAPAARADALSPTMQKVLDTIRASPIPLAASALATQLGISRPTAQRYLTELHRRGALQLHLEYGNAGRPVHRYGPAATV